MAGGAEFERGAWTPIDLMFVRDAAVADIIPKMTETEGHRQPAIPFCPLRPGSLGYEFMEARWGKEGVRSFLFALRKSVIGAARTPTKKPSR